MEHIDGINLKQFIQKAHQLINKKKLSLKNWGKIVKYVMWQLITTVRWLHDVFHCCHLDLCLENVMLQNADFIEQPDGTFKISDALSIKLGDFGVAELFPSNDNMPFKCNKSRITIDNEIYVAPKIYDNESYDARSADLWSLGMILFQCMIVESRNIWQPMTGYDVLREKRLKQYLAANNVLKYFKGYSFSLLQHLLVIDENERFNASQVIKHRWFKVYYERYEVRLVKKMINDTKSLQKQSEQISKLPFYLS